MSIAKILRPFAVRGYLVKRLLGEEARVLVLHVHNDDDGGEGDEQEGDPASKRF